MAKPPMKSKELSSATALKRLIPILPAGVGERHDHLDGRALVLECLKEGLVRHLFLELPNTAQPTVDKILGDAQMNREFVWAAERHNFTRYDFPERHRAIGKCAQDKTRTTGLKGSLFLWGSDHFTSTSGSDDPLWNYIRGMYYFVAKGTVSPPPPPRRRPLPPLPPR